MSALFVAEFFEVSYTTFTLHLILKNQASTLRSQNDAKKTKESKGWKWTFYPLNPLQSFNERREIMHAQTNKNFHAHYDSEFWKLKNLSMLSYLAGQEGNIQYI